MSKTKSTFTWSQSQHICFRHWFIQHYNGNLPRSEPEKSPFTMLQEAAAAVGQMYASAIQELKALNIDSFLAISLTPIKRASRDRDANASVTLRTLLRTWMQQRTGNTPFTQSSRDLFLPTFSFLCYFLGCFPVQHFPFPPLHSPGRGMPLEVGTASMDGSREKPSCSPGPRQAPAERNSWSSGQLPTLSACTCELIAQSAELWAVRQEDFDKLSFPIPSGNLLAHGMWLSRYGQLLSSHCLLPACYLLHAFWPALARFASNLTNTLLWQNNTINYSERQCPHSTSRTVCDEQFCQL